VDLDGDGWLACAGDCDDGDGAVHPFAPEGCDGLDTDCVGGATDAELDADGDGQAPCAGDCDDDAVGVRLGGLERCDDGVDGDCDGVIDEGCEAPAGDDDDDTTGCEARGCGWSLGGPSGAVLLGVPLLAGFRRRRATGR
jgi:hypothetical protein